MSLKEIGKKAAVFAAIDKYVKNGHRIGIGSGSTIKYAVERLVSRFAAEHLDIVCVPTSFQAKLLIVEYKLPLTNVDQHRELDVAFDGADEVDGKLSLIKGGGGDCHFQEKLIASAAQTLIIIGDDSKDSVNLGDKWKKEIKSRTNSAEGPFFARGVRPVCRECGYTLAVLCLKCPRDGLLSGRPASSARIVGRSPAAVSSVRRLIE